MAPERGIEIHNGKVIIPGSQMDKLQLGTWASPLTQTIAAQVIVSAVINVIALGGAVHAGYFGVKGSVNATADLKALRARTTINTGITITGFAYAIHIEQEVLGTGIISGGLDGIRLEQYSEAGSEIQTSVHGIFISNFLAGTVPQYMFLRMQENSTATVYCGLYIRASQGDVEYFAILHGDKTGWAALGAPSTQSGWIRCIVGGLVRYIRLYSVAP